MIFSSVVSSSYAANNGKGNSKGKNTQEQRGEKYERYEGCANFSWGLDGVEISDLSEEEEEALYYQYREEKLARDIYNYFDSLYNEDVFENIADSEQTHMDAVKILLDRYDLDVPTGYGELEDEYDALKSEGEESLKKALEVGVKIEILDIEDIVDTLTETDNDDIKVIFTNIGSASYNHLRGFLLALDNNGYETDIDYSDYLDEDYADQRGSLKDLILDRLEEEEVELPDDYSVCGGRWIYDDEEDNNDEDEEDNDDNGYNTWKGSSNAQSSRFERGNDVSARVNNSKKSRYKTAIASKYSERINKFSPQTREKLIDAIDSLIEKVEDDSSYSDDEKETYISLYEALREYIVDSLDD